MIQSSQFLRRALLADAVFSGMSALGLTFGAGALASLLNLPEALLRETGLFLIAYTALVGWLGTRQIVPLSPAMQRGRSPASHCCSAARRARTCLARSSWWRRPLPPVCLPSCNLSACAKAKARWRLKPWFANVILGWCLGASPE